MNRLTDTGVIVIGGGIAGLTAACYLAQAGVRVMLFEKAISLGGHPRRSMRITILIVVVMPSIPEVQLQTFSMNLVLVTVGAARKGFRYSLKVNSNLRLLTS
jgi:cation diffusion facilitator CzcD-associated flavoprotein CzcO